LPELSLGRIGQEFSGALRASPSPTRVEQANRGPGENRMQQTSEPEFVAPSEYLTSMGIAVLMSPRYISPGKVAEMVLSLAKVPAGVSPLDVVIGPWESHEEAFQASHDAAERWVEHLDDGD